MPVKSEMILILQKVPLNRLRRLQVSYDKLIVFDRDRFSGSFCPLPISANVVILLILSSGKVV